MRIAMWSGPRNLSTAMMYSFGARSDFAVWDEPFYAPYLAASGADHPMKEQIIAAHESDPIKVAARCSGTIPAQKPNFYMKHMPHHMIDGFPMDWSGDCVNVHLIRHPARVVASYGIKREQVALEDLGFRQQAQLFDRIGGLVIDSADIRNDPERMLTRLCDAIGLRFDRAMLSWPEGGHPADGVWATHWYGAVHRSTGFSGPEGPLPQLDGRDAAIVAAALPFYDRLAAKKL
ncbi:HAD family hydrolase [Pseudogemmobacter sp. W21_MBD1_M6]|uniref:sulfotransferase-like domain-containing protein n=1 Tax=Pseudogemmobacter sp. W21_MBD1_M6 TaxID=3240271 RepID=UPI003F95B4EF